MPAVHRKSTLTDSYFDEIVIEARTGFTKKESRALLKRGYTIKQLRKLKKNGYRLEECGVLYRRESTPRFSVWVYLTVGTAGFVVGIGLYVFSG